MLASYGTVEKLASDLWDILLEESMQKLQKIDETDESIIYKYVLSNARQSVELEEWEEEIERHGDRLWRAARRRPRSTNVGTHFCGSHTFIFAGSPTERGLSCIGTL